MARLLCLFRIHDWLRMKWGGSLDCRECTRCHRFEIVGYGDWHKADRAKFPDTRPLQRES